MGKIASKTRSQSTAVTIHDDFPLAFYNTDKQELIAVFTTRGLAAKYLYPNQDQIKGTVRIAHAFKRKNKLQKTRFDFPVAVRRANEVQLNLLGSKDYVICIGYPLPLEKAMKGFDSTRIGMAESAEKGLERYRAEQKRAKEI